MILINHLNISKKKKNISCSFSFRDTCTRSASDMFCVIQRLRIESSFGYNPKVFHEPFKNFLISSNILLLTRDDITSWFYTFFFPPSSKWKCLYVRFTIPVQTKMVVSECRSASLQRRNMRQALAHWSIYSVISEKKKKN